MITENPELKYYLDSIINLSISIGKLKEKQKQEYSEYHNQQIKQYYGKINSYRYKINKLLLNNI